MILPSRPRWSPDHLRLHRHLRRDPALLPTGAPLLIAVSGGQDSMALLAMLCDLQRLHHWSLQLWHGDHRWRPNSSRQAAELADWAAAQGLTLHIDTWERPAAAADTADHPEPDHPSEAAARTWRYAQLDTRARSLGASHVVTAHTASDRAETLLLHLARGSHRRGLASLRSLRPLASGAQGAAGPVLVRPLLPFSRADTARLCRELALPVWPDASNDDHRYSRNRIRADVLPVLEALHPGAALRISAQAERLVAEVDSQAELVDLALRGLVAGDRLGRPQLVALNPATQGQLLHRWLEQRSGQVLAARQLEALLQRLQAGQAPGSADLGAGWQLQWDRCTLWLNPSPPSTSR
ncbi:MAG: tRNA lysidine(34) synthetase TilS [Cyanobacteriota bacterium]|nr:tRNA lysidine(34) synthetase TilS [Cyanobacteriota bacterium]